MTIFLLISYLAQIGCGILLIKYMREMHAASVRQREASVKFRAAMDKSIDKFSAALEKSIAETKALAERMAEVRK